MDAAIIDRLDDDPDQLKDILLHHILPKSNIKNKVSRRYAISFSSERSLGSYAYLHISIHCSKTVDTIREKGLLL